MKKVLLGIILCLLVSGTGVVVLKVHRSSVSSLHTQGNHPTPTLSTKTIVSTSVPTESATPTPVNTCNDLLVLVDKTYALPASYVPPDLVSLSAYGIPVTSTSLEGRLIMVPFLKQMMDDAKKASVSIVVVSPYRSFATQQAVYNSYVAAQGEAAANTFSAIPGHSQHQLGTAVDFSTASLHDQLDQSFGQTPAGLWLAKNSSAYGFIMSYPQGQEASTGYEYEPWHFRYIGVANAMKVEQSGLNLEVYLQKYGVLPHC